jgi:LacI family transcriptional regulator
LAHDKRVTIRDVAIKSGHAVSTVSNALADKRHVSEETKQHVKQVAAELGYRPSTLARALRMRLSSTIGVLVADVGNPATPEFIRGVDDIAVREGCTILLCNTDDQESRQISQMETLLDRQVDGMILISQHVESPAVRRLLDQVPFVLLQRRSSRFRDDYVGSDNHGGTGATVDHLVDLGHRRIGFITGPGSSSTAMERLEAFESGVLARGCDSDPELVFRADYSRNSGYRAMEYFASLDTPPTAIIASNDVNALGVLDAANDMGLRIPQDMSVIGCDDIEFASLRRIDLTTLTLPKRDMGAAATELLLRRIHAKRTVQPREIIMPTRLTIRGSAAAPRGKVELPEGARLPGQSPAMAASGD